MKLSMLLMCALFVLSTAKDPCTGKECLPCLGTSCYRCAGEYGAVCVAGPEKCPNNTIIIIGPGQTDKCPITTTTTLPATSTTTSSPAMNFFAYFGIISAVGAGLILLLLLTFTIFCAFKYFKNQKQQQEYQQIMEGSVSPTDEENIPLEELLQAESVGHIQTSRGPHSYGKPNYDDEEEELYSRSEGRVVDMTSHVKEE